ncbi:MAG: DUF6491 family protein [Pseudomonadota bacterium]
MHTRATLLLFVAAVGGAAAAAEMVPDAREVSIPFVSMGSINDWRADKSQGLWIQDVHRQWYYARIMEPCMGLDFAQIIGFDTIPGGAIDRSSSILVPHEGRCHITSLVRSGPPPKKVKHKD